MRNARPIAVLCALLLGCMAAGGAAADVTLSITITGSPDELIPLLEQLKRLGIGTEGGSEASPEEERIQLQMHSVTSDEEAAAEPPAPEEEELGLWGAAVQPSPAKPGDTVMVTVQVADSERRIDTIAVAVDGGEGLMFDLYDNGTHGDETARDGVWSYAMDVPHTLDVEQYTMTIVPYDRFGREVTLETPGGEPIPLREKLVLPVRR